MSLDKISGTDIKCYWAGQKKNVLNEYSALPIMENKCLKEKNSNTTKRLTEQQASDCFKELSGVCVNSAQCKHLYVNQNDGDVYKIVC